jgi:hypothetical protein
MGRGVDHPLPSRAEIKEIVELYFYYLCGPARPVRVRSFIAFIRKKPQMQFVNWLADDELLVFGIQI